MPDELLRYLAFFDIAERKMILNRPLTPVEMKISQRYYNLYSAVNGMSYMCLGETVLILFALRLGCRDAVISVLGAMIYVGFLFLPLGKVMTARTGAVRSQADFWVMRNIASLIIAAAAPAVHFGYHKTAVCLLVLGAFLFYGFRAAGVVMSQPLVGEICPAGERGRFVAISWTCFYAAGFAALLGTTALLKFFPGVGAIFAVILIGAALGVTSSVFLRRVSETGAIRESAKRPVLKEYRRVLAVPVIRRQIYAGMVCYGGVILVVPISLLTVKKGFLAADTQALIFSAFQLFGSICASFVQSRISDRLGGKRMLAIGYGLLSTTALYWIIVPRGFSWGPLLIPFLIAAFGSVGVNNALTQYYLETVPRPMRVIASIFFSIASGVVAGLAGLTAGSSLLFLAARLNDSGDPLLTYRLYFGAVLLLLAVLSPLILRLPTPKIRKNA